MAETIRIIREKGAYKIEDDHLKQVALTISNKNMLRGFYTVRVQESIKMLRSAQHSND